MDGKSSKNLKIQLDGVFDTISYILIFTLFTQFRKEVNTQYGLLHVLQSYSEPANKILFRTFFSGDDNGQKPHGSDAVFMHRIVVQLQPSS